ARLIGSPGLTFHRGHPMTAAHRHGICNSEKRGASEMPEKDWNRVPIDAQSIDAPLSRAAVFLVVTVANELTALTKVCLALDGLDDLVKTVGFRDLSARLSCIVGIGCSLWDRFTSTSNRWNCDRLRRLRERSTRHRRHRAIFSSISDLNAPICALILSAFCWTVLALA